jgi:hypothetical protein
MRDTVPATPSLRIARNRRCAITPHRPRDQKLGWDYQTVWGPQSLAEPSKRGASARASHRSCHYVASTKRCARDADFVGSGERR